MIETDVLIVGSGPAGSSAAALLSTYGIDNMLVTKYRWLADTPRAHITNQRTMEVLRDLGLEQQVMQQATPNHLMGHNVFCTSLAGEELGRLRTWGTDPLSQARHRLASPTMMNDMPQNLMEPILFGAACARGTQARLSTEYLALTQDADGVTATVRDRLTGHEYQIRARYLIGADGGNSKVASDIGLPMQGRMGIGGSINILFNADLSRYVAHRPSVLYWVLQPGSNVGGIGMGLVRMVRTWDEWLIVWGYDIDGPAPQVTEDICKRVAWNLIGDDSIPLQIKSWSTWTVNHMHATHYQRGRVFCVGDAVHRHPPSNGLGSNTSIQDSYNLAWKLAMVLQGHAGSELLESYSVERAPVGRQIVVRANKSIGEFGPIFGALGLLDSTDPAVMQANMEKRKEDTPEAKERRKALRAAIAAKVYEFDAHGVEMNQHYDSNAVLAGPGDERRFAEDAELVHQPSSCPGARLPHVWVERDRQALSTLDLVGHGRYTLLTGIGGDDWRSAVAALAASGFPIRCVSIGPDQDYQDPFGDWARISEIEDDGALLVRPDQVVAWRQRERAADCAAALGDAVGRVVGRMPVG